MPESDDIFTRIRNDEFKTKLPYANRKQDPKAHEAYRADEARLHEEFKAAIAKEFGVEDHPKRDLLFSIAWEQGHAYGQHEVACHYQTFVDLLAPVKVRARVVTDPRRYVADVEVSRKGCCVGVLTGTGHTQGEAVAAALVAAKVIEIEEV